MKTLLKFSLILLFISIGIASFSQDTVRSITDNYEIKTILGSHGLRASGGYGALTNKFTRIGGQYANLTGIYGGWYINHRFLLGVAGAAVTNNIEVPEQYSTMPGEKMSYEYGQFGLMTEYTVASNRAVHVAFQLLVGSAFTTQYIRDVEKGRDDYNYDFSSKAAHDTNFFVVTEPGVNVEVNIFKWMRFSPGISYRAAFGSDAKGLKDKDLSGMSANVSLKFGKF